MQKHKLYQTYLYQISYLSSRKKCSFIEGDVETEMYH